MTPFNSLFVLYIPGLDRRRLGVRDTPYLASLLERGGSVRLSTHPTTELFPTLISGVNPPEHLIWQVSRRENGAPAPSRLAGFPDWVTTTAQCFRHAFDPGFDLAAIPERRRRRFEIHRIKYTRRATDTEILNEFAGHSTLFGILGDRSRYRISTKFGAIPSLLRSIPDSRLRLDFLEFYAFDLLSHWNLDRPSVISRHLQLVDRFVAAVANRCERTDTRVVVLVDHGQERVTETIDVRGIVKRSGAKTNEVLEYVEVGVARYWFGSEAARSTVQAALENEPRIVLKTRRELGDWGLDFPDDRFGELYAIARPGTIFFPHDFYHPLANLYMGLSKPGLWRRLLSPIHRGSHGQVPGFPAEEGFVLAIGDEIEATRGAAQLVDFAPSILALVGASPSPTMKGAPFFRRAGSPSL